MARKTQFPVLLHCSDSRFIKECEIFVDMLNDCCNAAALANHNKIVDYYAANRWALECLVYEMKYKKHITKAKRILINSWVKQVMKLSIGYLAKLETEHGIVV